MSSELINPPKAQSMCWGSFQEPGSAKSAGQRRMGRNCCTRKLIRSNVDMQSQSEDPEISSNKECESAVIGIFGRFPKLLGGSHAAVGEVLHLFKY